MNFETSSLILGDNASDGDVTGVPGVDGQPTIPATPVIPAAPAGMELPAVPDRSMLDQLYHDEAAEGRWTAAFAVSDTPIVADQSDAKTSVARVSVALAVAMGGFWMHLAGRPDQRKRPELAS
jgi:hypothetical protein